MRGKQGGKQKESSKEKKQRRKDMMEIQRQIKTIVLPTIGVVAVLILAYVYIKTRPTAY